MGCWKVSKLVQSLKKNKLEVLAVYTCNAEFSILNHDFNFRTENANPLGGSWSELRIGMNGKFCVYMGYYLETDATKLIHVDFISILDMHKWSSL